MRLETPFTSTNSKGLQVRGYFAYTLAARKESRRFWLDGTVMNIWEAPSEYDAQEGADMIVPRMRSMVDNMGLEHFSFAVLQSADDDLSPISQTLRTSYPAEWMDRYTRRKYWDVDPVTDMGKRSIRPFLWGQGPFLRNFTKKQRVVFDEADAFGISYGLTIPVRGAKGELSVFTVVSSHKAHLQEVMQCASGRVYSAAIDTHERWKAKLPERLPPFLGFPHQR
jgi:hypothetical protein